MLSLGDYSAFLGAVQDTSVGHALEMLLCIFSALRELCLQIDQRKQILLGSGSSLLGRLWLVGHREPT